MILCLYFDGSNKDKYIQYGWVLYDGIPGKGDHTEIIAGNGRISTTRSTCNFAEYSALAFGLKFIHENEWLTENCDSLYIRGDSKLIVNHVTGKWKCKVLRLRKLRDICRDYLHKIKLRWEIEWIPRAENKRADGLTR